MKNKRIFKTNKKVYVGLAADILHKGHINILEIANKLGDVTVGLLTDKAISSYKNLPYLTFEQRKVILQNLKNVKNVISQNTLDYRKNLNLLKPDYVVHGDDWKKGIQKKTRSQVIKTLKKWGGRLIEPKYTDKISSTLIKKEMSSKGYLVENRRSLLKRLINSKEIVRVIECHSPLTGIMIEETKILKKNKCYEFDALWSSSLTDSALRGKPDNQTVDYSTRLNWISEIMDVTNKPIIFDGDNGGRIEHLPFLVKSLERLGVSAIVIEDKKGLKKNSLFKKQNINSQESIKNFSKKIKIVKSTRISNNFLIVARIESLILGKSNTDAVKRAKAYVKSGADAILIHSKENNPKQIFKFAKEFNKYAYSKPLIVVPSTYSRVKETELRKNGIKIVIYANHLLRSSYPAMQNTLKEILHNQRSFNSEKKIISIKKIINLIK